MNSFSIIFWKSSLQLSSHNYPPLQCVSSEAIQHQSVVRLKSRPHNCHTCLAVQEAGRSRRLQQPVRLRRN